MLKTKREGESSNAEYKKQIPLNQILISLLGFVLSPWLTPLFRYLAKTAFPKFRTSDWKITLNSISKTLYFVIKIRTDFIFLFPCNLLELS